MTAIDWPAFLLVLLVALGSAVITVSLFAVGVRLLATPAPGTGLEGAEPEPDDQGEDDPTTPIAARPVGATIGAIVFFALGAGVALTGVILIVH
jgi:hypothetical protein